MGCSPFANSCFQMGVTVMGFAEHFGQRLDVYICSEQPSFSRKEMLYQIKVTYAFCILYCLMFVQEVSA